MRWIRCTLTLTLNPDVTLTLTLALAPDPITLAVTNPTLNPPLTQDPSATLTSSLSRRSIVMALFKASMVPHAPSMASHPPD